MVREIENFLLGKGASWEWDDFISIPIKESPELDAIRLLCAKIPDKHPPDKVGRYCSEEGIQVLQKIMEDLRREG